MEEAEVSCSNLLLETPGQKAKEENLLDQELQKKVHNTCTSKKRKAENI